MHEHHNRERLQFRVLYRVFLLRVVDLELLSTHSDTAKLLGQFAALFAAVSFMFTVWVIFTPGKFPQPQLWTMEHLLIATTMLVAGLFSALTWDSIFPDRHDVLILAPLPVRARTLFCAKLTASIAALSLAILALNIFTGLVWPFIFSPANGGIFGAIRSLAAYWITILASAIFIFCSVLAIQSLAAQLLPRQLFLRLSALLQVAAVCLFLSVYVLEPSLENVAALTAPENQRVLAWSPTYWFLGLFQELNGSMHPALASLAARARMGLGVAILGAAAAVLLSYLRTLRKVVEQPDILPSSRRSNWSLRLTNPLQNAILLFSARTLLRSRQHRVLLSFYLGIGFAVVLAYLKPTLDRPDLAHSTTTATLSVPLLAASTLMMCIAVTGMRVVFSMPIALRANWIFRITEARAVHIYLAAIRRTLLLLACTPVCIFFAVLFLAFCPLGLAAEHLILLWLLGMVLTELCLYDFQKIPFTCSYLPGKGKIQFVFWAFVLLLPLTYAAARLESRVLQHLATYATVLVVLSSIAAAARWRTAVSTRSATALNFDEVPEPDILALGLRTDGELLIDPL